MNKMCENKLNDIIVILERCDLNQKQEVSVQYNLDITTYGAQHLAKEKVNHSWDFHHNLVPIVIK